MINLPLISKNLSNIGTIVGTGSSIAVTIYILTLFQSTTAENRPGFIIVLCILMVASFISQGITIFLGKKAKDDSTILTEIQDIDIEKDVVTIQIPRQRIIIAYKPQEQTTGDMSVVWKESSIGKQTEDKGIQLGGTASQPAGGENT